MWQSSVSFATKVACQALIPMFERNLKAPIGETMCLLFSSLRTSKKGRHGGWRPKKHEIDQGAPRLALALPGATSKHKLEWPEVASLLLVVTRS